MEKQEGTPRYYLVTACIKAKGFNKLLLEGIYATAQEKTVPAIKKECRDFIKPSLNFGKYNICPEEVKKDIRIKSLTVDFLLNADLLFRTN